MDSAFPFQGDLTFLASGMIILVSRPFTYSKCVYRATSAFPERPNVVEILAARSRGKSGVERNTPVRDDAGLFGLSIARRVLRALGGGDDGAALEQDAVARGRATYSARDRSEARNTDA